VVMIQDKVVLRLKGGYRWTQQGVQFDMPVMAGAEMRNRFGRPRSKVSLPLNCWRYNANGTPLTIVLQLISTNNGYIREQCHILGQEKNAKPSTNYAYGLDQIIIVPFTVTQPIFD